MHAVLEAKDKHGMAHHTIMEETLDGRLTPPTRTPIAHGAAELQGVKDLADITQTWRPRTRRTTPSALAAPYRHVGL